MKWLNRIFFIVSFLGFTLWVSSCSEEPKAEQNFDSSFYITKGNHIVKRAFSALKGQLMNQMQTNGVLEAITYCNENALALSDSIGKFDQVQISRVAERNRNPKNSLSTKDKVIYDLFERQLEMNIDPSPELSILENGEVVYYQPIILTDKCVMCHGELDTQISKEVQGKIAELYPQDKAVGYSVGDLRGMWKINLGK